MSSETTVPQFEALAADARPALEAFAFKLCKDANLAHDLTQEALFTAYRKFDKFNPARGSFRSWVNSILHNRYRDYMRSAKRREIPVSSLPGFAEDEDVLQGTSIDAEEEALSNLRLADMLKRLNSAEKRIAVSLSRGLSEQDIMEQMCLTHQQFEATVVRMRRKLADLA